MRGLTTIKLFVKSEIWSCIRRTMASEFPQRKQMNQFANKTICEQISKPVCKRLCETFGQNFRRFSVPWLPVNLLPRSLVFLSFSFSSSMTNVKLTSMRQISRPLVLPAFAKAGFITLLFGPVEVVPQSLCDINAIKLKLMRKKFTKRSSMSW